MLCTVGFSEDLVKVDIKKLKKIYTSEIKSAFKNKVMTGYVISFSHPRILKTPTVAILLGFFFVLIQRCTIRCTKDVPNSN